MRNRDRQPHVASFDMTTQSFVMKRLGDCVLKHSGRQWAPSGLPRGFTLIEVIITVAMITLLVGIFSATMFGTIGGRSLDEGTIQFDTMLRLARAEAANQGRRLRLTYSPLPADESTSESVSADAPISTIRFEWEPQPLAQPGEFIPYENGSWTLSLPTKLVIVQQCMLTGESALQTLTYDSELMTDDSSLETLHPINFFPDGTTDSARIVLLSTDPGDNRTAVITLDGINGRITSSLMTPSELDAYQAELEASSEGNRGY